MNTTVIIVTYADRFNYVDQVISSVLLQGVGKIVIVNNNSTVESSEKLAVLAQNNKIIELITFKKNRGTAFAFSIGIKNAIKNNAEFIWLLDDDNIPEKDAYKILRNEWFELSDLNKRGKLIVSSLRSDRRKYIDAIIKNEPYNIIGENNIFRSFHIKKYVPFQKKQNVQVKNISGNISAVPYGGMFFHKDVINEIGLPDDRYFVYCDDFDFCCRHIQNGRGIFIVLKSKIVDIEKSWNVSGKAIEYIAQGNNRNKIYYSIRNRVFLEKKYLIKSWPIYITNMLIYSFAVTFLVITKFTFKNLKTYYIAVFHGLIGKMGYNDKFDLPGAFNENTIKG